MSQAKAKLRSQEYATWAFAKVNELKKEALANKKDLKELKSHIRRLPSVIQTSGLAQTLLFYGKKHEAIARALAEHLTKNKDISECVKELCNKDASEYRLLTREAMELAQWLKRFAEVMLEGD